MPILLRFYECVCFGSELFSPFSLSREGDRRGSGATESFCLGKCLEVDLHWPVAMLASWSSHLKHWEGFTAHLTCVQRCVCERRAECSV